MRIAFIHYRTGERDGVSLEIEKRAEILQKAGHEVFYITGFDGLERKNVFLIKELDIKTSYNKFLREDCFYNGLFEENFMISLYFQLENKIYKKLNKAFERLKPELVFVHNIFSHAYNLPATTALLKVLDKHQVKTVAVNHDFWFERPYFQKPKYFFIKEILQSLPPVRPYIIKQQVINSLAQEEILSRRGIKAELIGDYFEYSKPLAKIDDFNRDLREYFGIKKDDLLVLHATRITQRKNIENAFVFARELEKALRKLAPIKILGRTFKRTSRVVVLLPNFVEVDALPYYKEIKKLAEKIKLNVIFAWEKFMPERKEENGVKIYSFWDAYPFADLITYTSSWEGFGNQFLEAVHFKKLPVVFEYPVFERDLKKEGYEYISLGKELKRRNGLAFVPKERIKNAVEKTINLLTKPEKIKQIVEKNFKIAQKNHSLEKLEAELKALIKTID